MASLFVIVQKRNGMFVQYNAKGERFAVEDPLLATKYEAGDALRAIVMGLNQEGHEFAAAPLENPPFYTPRGDWALTKIHEAADLAKSLGITNISRFVNQVPNLRAIADSGNLEELNRYVLEIKASKLSIGYPNSYTYFSG